MKTSESSINRPYYPISQYYRNLFGQKVYKITVSVARTCPHRNLRKKGGGCVFCDEWGSAGHHLKRVGSLNEQIVANREKLRKRYRVNRFLVYFQPYTNTYTELSVLEANMEMVLGHDQVCGIVLGTRPDCLPEKVFSLFDRFSQKTYVAVELGAQSFVDQRLVFLNRGHTAKQSLEAIERLHRQTNVDIGLHLMFGLPGETEREIIETAKRINELPVSNVKLHNLHVLADTPLECLYRSGAFEPIELEAYARRVIIFLTHLSPKIAVQRLAAVAARWDELIAPRWTKERMRPTQYIIKEMEKHGLFQGLYCYRNPIGVG